MNGNPEMRTPRLGSPTADLSWRSQSRAKPGSDLRPANSITKWRIWDQWDSHHPHPSSASQTQVHHPWTTAPGTYILPVPSSVLGARASLRSTQEQLHQQWLAQCADAWVLAPPRVASHFSLCPKPLPPGSRVRVSPAICPFPHHLTHFLDLFCPKTTLPICWSLHIISQNIIFKCIKHNE